MTNILGLKQNRWIVGAVLLLTTCNLQAQEQPNAREKFERGNWFVSGGLNGEWLTKTIGNVYAGGKISGGVYLTPLSGFRATAEIGKNRIGNDTEATQLSANLDLCLVMRDRDSVFLLAGSYCINSKKCVWRALFPAADSFLPYSECCSAACSDLKILLTQCG